MNNFFKKLHLWVSVPFGIVITITCFTGALLVFESDIVALYNKDLTAVVPMGDPLPVSAVAEKVEAGLADGVEVTGVVVSGDPAEAYKVNISRPSRTAVYVDQYTGEVKGKAGRLPFFNTVRRLHRWLMDTRPADGGIYWGKMIVGASTLAFVGILITGIVIWWPRNRKMLKNRLKIVMRKGKNRFWYDLHVAGGFYVALLLLAMALTGLTWSYGWYRDAFYSMFGEATMQNDKGKGSDRAGKSDRIAVEEGAATMLSLPADTAAVQPDAVTAATVQADAVTSATVQADAVTAATMLSAEEESEYYSWQKALEAVQAKYASYKTITLSDGTASVALGGLGNQRANDKYSFNTSTGEITSSNLYADTPVRSKASGWVRTIHVGTWGGVVTKVLYFLAALLGATLPLTGYYFWIRRLYNKKKRKK